MINKNHIVAVCLGLVSWNAWTADAIVHGVNLSVVQWNEMCANVKPVALDNGYGKCAKSHPADPLHEKNYLAWTGPGAPPPSPPNCEYVADRFEKYTTPKKEGWGGPWAGCKSAFMSSLASRALDRKKKSGRYAMSFSEWRAQYFGPYLVK